MTCYGRNQGGQSSGVGHATVVGVRQSTTQPDVVRSQATRAVSSILVLSAAAIGVDIGTPVRLGRRTAQPPAGPVASSTVASAAFFLIDAMVSNAACLRR
jgi:hypothetical protein